MYEMHMSTPGGFSKPSVEAGACSGCLWLRRLLPLT